MSKFGSSSTSWAGPSLRTCGEIAIEIATKFIVAIMLLIVRIMTPRTHSIFAAVMLLLAVNMQAAAPAYDIVYFDLPDSLEPAVIPSPTAELAALPAYPNDPNQLTLVGAVYKPDPLIHGDGPYPTIIYLHGSGGMWSSYLIANGLWSSFEEWALVLTDLGYLCLFPDSYHPRGIDTSFSGRKPHYDPAQDDALASSSYERPKDVVAALEYLTTRTDVDVNNIGMLGLSHGAQTGLSVILDPSINNSPYTAKEPMLHCC